MAATREMITNNAIMICNVFPKEQTTNIKELYKKFAIHCVDFEEDLTGGGSKALEFCSKILYKVVPESKKVNKHWIFLFEVMNPDGTSTPHRVFVGNHNNPKGLNISEDVYMSMTVKEAGLTAMNTFMKVIPMGVDMGKYLMTPLAQSVFPRTGVVDIASTMKWTITETLIKINASCQDGGQYLDQCDGTIAALAIYTTTRNIKNENDRVRICSDNIRQLINQQKMINRETFFTLARFTTGRMLPPELQFENLIKIYNMQRTK